MPAVDFADIQGLVRFGHGRLTSAAFLLLETADAAAARAWLAAAPVTTAERLDAPPETALQLAFTAPGLRALGLAPEIVAQFPQAYLAGMAGEASRSRRLGDLAGNDPAAWRWGRPEPHAILMLYAAPGGLERFRAAVTGAPFERAFRVVATLAANTSRGVEPFGFVDGVSEPVIDWDGRQAGERGERLAYSNLLAPGEVVLGQPNEYGERPAGPLVGLQVPGASGLPEAPEAQSRRDFGRNGTFLVLRQLEQDVRGFWRFLDAAAGGDPARREALATAMVGRRRDGGAPIADGAAIPGGRPGNDFTYDADPDGFLCPVGAHIRRANPRTGDHPPGAQGALAWLASTLGFRRRRDGQPGRHDLVASTRFHRIVRRGREYGEPLSPEAALGEGPEVERGLHFVCLCANIVRQFEFVQNAWIDAAKFDGLFAEQDPLLGNRVPLPGGLATDGFSIPRRIGPDERIEGLPAFVTVRGGGYFFMPGIRALRFIAGGGGS
jgi:deferrochelatase/peroxidase EfeB